MLLYGFRQKFTIALSRAKIATYFLLVYRYLFIISKVSWPMVLQLCLKIVLRINFHNKCPIKLKNCIIYYVKSCCFRLLFYRIRSDTYCSQVRVALSLLVNKKKTYTVTDYTQYTLLFNIVYML